MCFGDSFLIILRGVLRVDRTQCPEERPACEIVATEAPPVTTQPQETSDASSAVPEKAESSATTTVSPITIENITTTETPLTEADPPTKAPSISGLDFEEPPATPSSATTLFGLGVRLTALSVVLAMTLF